MAALALFGRVGGEERLGCQDSRAAAAEGDPRREIRSSGWASPLEAPCGVGAHPWRLSSGKHADHESVKDWALKTGMLNWQECLSLGSCTAPTKAGRTRRCTTPRRPPALSSPRSGTTRRAHPCPVLRGNHRPTPSHPRDPPTTTPQNLHSRRFNTPTLDAMPVPMTDLPSPTPAHPPPALTTSPPPRRIRSRSSGRCNGPPKPFLPGGCPGGWRGEWQGG